MLAITYWIFALKVEVHPIFIRVSFNITAQEFN